jgi:lactate permease
MILALQALPLLLLIGLLFSGRVAPVPAVVAALIAAIPAAYVSLPDSIGLPGFLAEQILRGAYLALQPMGVVLAGLLFHAAVSGVEASKDAEAATPRRIFIATLLAGCFLESVTGFGVGAVFALASLRGMGIIGAPAGAMALLALCLIPWGGLGPGSLLGAALIGLPAQDILRITALPNALWLLALGPVLWRLCSAAGLAVSAAEKRAQMGYLLAVAILLVGCHWLLPFEVIGVIATGLPLVFALWRLAPPQDGVAWRRALARLAPYAFLTVALLLARTVPNPPAWQPFADLPAFPVTHVSLVLASVALLLLARRAGALRRAQGALKRGARPALIMLLYVLLARWMGESGATAALAREAAAALGPLAPYAVPPLGLMAGIVTGTNVGSNAALMPVQYKLGLAAGLPPVLAPGVHNFVGAAGAGVSFAVTGMICGLLADGTKPAQLWRLLWPSLAAVLLLGWAAMAFLA